MWAAVRRQAGLQGGLITRDRLLAQELDWIVRQTASRGATPAQTLSRELQELRSAGLLLFEGPGHYRVAKATWSQPDVAAAARTQREMLAMVRVGQSRFRAALLARWDHRCPLTGISEAPLLKASHIVAWRACSVERDRINPENGLLLSALWDAAFDQGLIGFDQNGAAIAYPGLSNAARNALRIDEAPPLDRLSPENIERLALHRAFCEAGEWR